MFEMLIKNVSGLAPNSTKCRCSTQLCGEALPLVCLGGRRGEMAVGCDTPNPLHWAIGLNIAMQGGNVGHSNVRLLLTKFYYLHGSEAMDGASARSYFVSAVQRYCSRVEDLRQSLGGFFLRVQQRKS